MTIQRDLDRLGRKADKNLIEFSEEKCEILERNNSRHQLESRSAKKDLAFPGRHQVDYEFNHEPLPVRKLRVLLAA